jgi:glyoxylase-like metal-dependent hydrolase (beta-lactamase superfamily II)
MEEILPGLRHWTATHPKIGIEVSSHWVPGAGALIDPLLPPGEGVAAFREQPPDRVLLSNRHHLRDSEQIVAELGCRIECSRPGMHEFGDGPAVEAFDFGDEVAPGIEALEVGAICPDETALHIPARSALACADGVIHYGGLQFVPDGLMDDPEDTKAALRAAYARLAETLEFDNLLVAHGDPVVGGGREALRQFAAAEP